MKYPYAILTSFILFVCIASCAIDQGETKAPLGKEFSLPLGQTVYIEDQSLRVTFKEVLEDSRCPRGVTCIWVGRVTCVVEITHDGSSYRMALTEPGLSDEYSRESYEEYGLAFHVTPYPEEGKKIPPDEYSLRLTVSKLPRLFIVWLLQMPRSV